MNKKSLVLILALVLALVSLTACGNKNDAASTGSTAADPAKAIVGTWLVDIEGMAKAQGVDPTDETVKTALEAAQVGFEFTADGKMNVIMGGTTTGTADYKVAGDKITMDAGAMSGVATGTSAEYAYKLDGNKLTLTIEGVEVVLVKK